MINPKQKYKDFCWSSHRNKFLSFSAKFTMSHKIITSSSASTRIFFIWSNTPSLSFSLKFENSFFILNPDSLIVMIFGNSFIRYFSEKNFFSIFFRILTQLGFIITQKTVMTRMIKGNARFEGKKTASIQ